MKHPIRYEDLTVNQFMQLESLKSEELDAIDKAVKRVAILTEKSIEYIETLPAKEVYNILSNCLFLASDINEMPLTTSVKLGGITFNANTDKYTYTVSQHKDFDEFLKQAGGEWHKVLPELLTIVHNENGKYIQEKHQRNTELFKQAKLKDVLGAVFFYSVRYKIYSNNISTCLENQNKILQTLITEMESDTAFQIFLNSGVGNTALV